MRPAHLAPLLSLGLFVAAVAGASPAEQHPTTGQWQVAHHPSAVRAELDTAIDALSVDLNIVMREVARGILQDATKVCARYDIHVVDDTLAFSCDDHPTMHLSTTAPLRARNAAGLAVQARAEVAEDHVVIRWTSDAGSRINTFRRVDDQMVLTARVHSRRLPRPLRWTVRYRVR
mgnify:CR=1 FL=1